jgi:hypothetical protein
VARERAESKKRPTNEGEDEMMMLTETVTGVYGPEDLDVVIEIPLDDKLPSWILEHYRSFTRPTPVFYNHFFHNGTHYRHDYRKDFPCGRPRSHTSQDSCFAEYLADLKVICND